MFQPSFWWGGILQPSTVRTYNPFPFWVSSICQIIWNLQRFPSENLHFPWTKSDKKPYLVGDLIDFHKFPSQNFIEQLAKKVANKQHIFLSIPAMSRSQVIAVTIWRPIRRPTSARSCSGTTAKSGYAAQKTPGEAEDLGSEVGFKWFRNV